MDIDRILDSDTDSAPSEIRIFQRTMFIRKMLLCGVVGFIFFALSLSFRQSNLTKKFLFSDLNGEIYTNDLTTQSSRGEIWPLPQNIEYKEYNRSLKLNGINFTFLDNECDILKFAQKTYEQRWLFPRDIFSNSSNILNVVVKMDTKCPGPKEYPSINMDESYTLDIPSEDFAKLESKEVWGILRGLETLSQLIFWENNMYFIRVVSIKDWPEYKVRGILLDTSRHYLHKNIILRQIDLLAQNKMNFFHWHIVDSESFPFSSYLYPNLTKMGAYSMKHVYSKANISDILKYARLRGVRVMVEFDTPGHMHAWKGGPEGLLSECRNAIKNLVPSAMIDPSLEKNYDFLKNFFREVLTLFPEKYVHMGGDETNFWLEDCWAQNEQIKNFMREQKLKNITMLENYYYNRLQGIMEELFKTDSERKMVFWQEVFDKNNPGNNTIIHIWKNDEVEKVTSNGHEVIYSSCWYLNYITYPTDFSKIYNCNPRSFVVSQKQKDMILGGVATMWGEIVDGTNLEARLWPRASAVAERLWSSFNSTKETEKAFPRLHEHRCRMIARGYHSQPVLGPGDFCELEWNEPIFF